MVAAAQFPGSRLGDAKNSGRQPLRIVTAQPLESSLKVPAFIFFKGGGYCGQEGAFGEFFVGAFVGLDAEEAEFVAVL